MITFILCILPTKKICKGLIASYNIISEHDWHELLDISIIKEYDRNDILFHQGEIAQVNAFVLQGSFKNVSYQQECEEKILAFNFQFDFLASCESYNNKVPFSFAIVAMEPSVAVVVNSDELVRLCFSRRWCSQNDCARQPSFCLLTEKESREKANLALVIRTSECGLLLFENN